MKSFLLSVRFAARSGASINPLMWACAVGVRPNQSHPRLMTLPNVPATTDPSSNTSAVVGSGPNTSPAALSCRAVPRTVGRAGPGTASPRIRDWLEHQERQCPPPSRGKAFDTLYDIVIQPLEVP